MTTFIKKHSLAFLFSLIILFLVFGLVQSYGWKYTPKLLFLLIPFFGVYFLSYSLITKQEPLKLFQKLEISEKKMDVVLYAIILFILLFQILHYLLLGNVPLIKAILCNDYYKIAEIRQDIKFLKNPFISYTSAFMLKAIIPFFLVLFYIRDKRKFWILLFIGVFYAMALIQKAFIVTILIPLIVYLIWNKKWFKAGVFAFTFFAGVVFLVIVTNPSLRFWGEDETIAKKETVNVSSEVSSALYDRVFITTGKMVGNWFAYVPDSLPYLKGDGYHFLSPITGHEYQDYSREIYKKIYVKETKMGFEGTATTAFFMYDYANFGNLGLALSGVFLALIFVFISNLFGDDYEMLFVFNSISIIWLSSAAFSTTLFSGGWGPTILLFIVFRQAFKNRSISRKQKLDIY